MMTPQQIPLDLGHRNAMGREDFMIAPSNAAAVAWIDRWPDWPAPVLVLYGPPASGKTHLGAVWKAKAGDAFIDDVDQRIGHHAQEEELFHLYNTAKEDQKTILMTAASAPQGWDFMLPDLASRLKAAPSVEIAPPDDSLMAALLVKLFNDRQIHINEGVIQYILPRIERSTSAVRDLVHRADHAALSGKRRVTVPLVASLL